MEKLLKKTIEQSWVPEGSPEGGRGSIEVDFEQGMCCGFL